MEKNGCIVDSVVFANKRFSGLKFLLAPFNIFSFFRVYRKIKSFVPDIVHIHNWSFAASPSIIWAAVIKNIPIVLTLHNFRIICPSATLSHNETLYYDSVNSYFPWISIRKAIYRGSVILTFWQVVTTRLHYFLGTWKKITFFISLTSTSKRIFESSFLKIPAYKIIIKPNFAEDNSSRENIQRQDHFLFVGRLSEEKGIRLLLEVFAGSSKKIRIIGDGPLLAAVKNAAAANGNITYLGYREKSFISEEMKHCTALLFPSVCIETFGMTIIEAFSNSTPVIASNIGAATDLVTGDVNGILFENGNARELETKCQVWLEKTVADKNNFYKNCYSTFKEKYTADRNYDLLLAIYKKCLRQP